MTKHRLRAVASWVPALVVVPLAMAGAYVVAQPEDEHPELSRLLPFDRGTTWVYAVYDHDEPSGTRTRQVVGRAGLVDDTGLRDAVQLSSHYTDQPGVGASSSMFYLGFDGPRLQQYALRSQGQMAQLDPPAPAYELPLEEGHSWTYEGTFGTATMSFETTLEDVGDLELSGRTFRDCAHFVSDVEVEFEDGSADPEHLDEWACPGFGTVRTISTIEAQDSVVREDLVAFHGVEQEWRSDEAPDPDLSAETGAGSTVSFDQARTNAVAGVRLRDGLAWSDARDIQFRFAPVADDEIMVMTDNTGDVTASDLTTGAIRWRLNVAGPVVAPPVIAGDTVFVAAADKTLLAVSADDGATRWLRRLGDEVSAAPSVIDESVLVPTDDGSVTAVALDDGSDLWSHDLAGPVRDAPVVVDDRWVVADRSGRVAAYAVDGEELWTYELDEPLSVGPAAADGRVLVADQAEVVSAIDTDDGSLFWERRTRGRPNQPFAVGGDTVVATLANGRIEALDLGTGEHRWDARTPDVFAPAAIVGDEVVTFSPRGEIRLHDLADGHTVDGWDIPKVSPSARLDTDVGPALISDTLVFGGSVTAPGYTAALYAYPLTDEAERDGVVLGAEQRTFAATPVDRPVVEGDTVWMGATNGTLYRSDGPGPAEEVHRTETVQPGPAIGYGMVVAQQDDRYLAYPVEGGEPLWEAPAGDAIVGLSPAIGDDTVFLPQYGTGLTAVALDGTPRWTASIPGADSPTTPLPLPGGDVIFGGAGLARYDGATGRELWKVPDNLMFGHPAYVDGVVYAHLVRDRSPSGLGAFDAETGRQLWFLDNPNQVFSGRPAVSEGVVVDVDSLGRATAVDATNGSLLWELQLESAPAGSPIVIDGRVYLYGMGRNEDLYQREARLSVHDLHTGRFLGAYEPAASTFGDRLVTTATADGRLVIHTGDDLGALQLLEPRP
jgi:outer membrane protein assembly factor BamB